MAEARFVLGSMYRFGQGVDLDHAQAAKWFTLAAQQGVPMAQYSLGRLYLKGAGVTKSQKEAVKWFLKAAKQNLASAQLVLGTMYRNGRGVKRDAKQAVKWYVAAATGGNALAQANLGRMHAQGNGVRKDFKKAALWYRRAAERGLAHGQSLLGAMLAAGAGTKKNYSEAYFWLALAAKQGDKQAADFRDEVGKNLKSTQRTQLSLRAAAWKPKKRITFTGLTPNSLASPVMGSEKKNKSRNKEQVQPKTGLEILNKARSNPGKKAGMRIVEINRGAAEVARADSPSASPPAATKSKKAKPQPQPKPQASLKPPAPAQPKIKKPKIKLPRPGENFKDCPNCPEMVVVPGGTYQMGGVFGAGNLPAKPVHKVTLPKPFAIGKHEITRGQYAEFATATGRRSTLRCRYWTGRTLETFKSDNTRSWQEPGFKQNDRHPVVCVGWRDAKAYANWLAIKTAKPYRLPSEAEWEYVARAGGRKSYFFGDKVAELCRFANGADGSMSFEWRNKACSDGFARTAPVGSFLPNAFGLYDVHGNVSEWVEDCWNKEFVGAPSGDKPWLRGKCASRVIRGGSWMDDPGFLHYAYREGSRLAAQASHKGFRLALTLNK